MVTVPLSVLETTLCRPTVVNSHLTRCRTLVMVVLLIMADTLGALATGVVPCAGCRGMELALCFVAGPARGRVRGSGWRGWCVGLFISCLYLVVSFL